MMDFVWERRRSMELSTVQITFPIGAKSPLMEYRKRFLAGALGQERNRRALLNCASPTTASLDGHKTLLSIALAPRWTTRFVLSGFPLACFRNGEIPPAARCRLCDLATYHLRQAGNFGAGQKAEMWLGCIFSLCALNKRESSGVRGSCCHLASRRRA